jgi:hypothetical protein
VVAFGPTEATGVPARGRTPTIRPLLLDSALAPLHLFSVTQPLNLLGGFMAKNAASAQLAFVSTLGVVEILGPGPLNHVCVRSKGGVGRHFVHVSMLDGLNSVPARRAKAEQLKAEKARAAGTALAGRSTTRR